ncbi:hypothetical protein DYB25_001430 [Aphanomyces astaci]|uniref:GH16 domain-containing protein n=1 Tax=Aphanomyces astaci TaxID=112090 RepID=A0A397AS92_APHAT|nr:hypothetical protein DYB25_001430 [Aphanomyces astaci]RHY08487.1 hypothetical protein DYB36_001440 [Aphanomyces astaci]RHY64889.1 hypothetical protein DYB34_001232 [Aphanomyces astaci]
MLALWVWLVAASIIGGSISASDIQDTANATAITTNDTTVVSSFAGGLNASEWELTFEDHFDRLDLAKWHVHHDCSTHRDCAHNDEKQVYLRDQAYVQNGHLVLEASNLTHVSEASGTRRYRSAKLDTAHSFSQRYGKFEARIQFPRGAGMWPALMPKGGRCWPMDGEIDIVEYVGQTPQTIYGNYHFGGACNANLHDDPAVCGPTGASQNDDSLSYAFHEYSVVWTPTSIQWFMDGQEFYRLPPKSGCRKPASFFLPSKPFYIILNFAVGGTWPGDPTAATTFPQRMVVDYVKVYQRRTTTHTLEFEPIVFIVTIVCDRVGGKRYYGRDDPISTLNRLDKWQLPKHATM